MSTSTQPATTDMIIRADEVRTGDLMLSCRGELAEVTVPQDASWQPEGHTAIWVAGSWVCPRNGKLTAVRRAVTQDAGPEGER